MKSLRQLLTAAIMCLGFTAGAQVTNRTANTADTFLCTGSTAYQSGTDLTGLNFGGAGALAVAPASALKGEFQSVIQFNLANSLSAFNATYGVNHWMVAAVSLELTSNYGVAGVQPNNPIFNAVSSGSFVIEWLADNDWSEGTGTPNMPGTDGITFNALPALLSQPHVPLCTNLFVPPGNNVPVVWPLPLNANLVADITSGGTVTFRLYAADANVGYLFNSHEYGRGNQPLIIITAVPLLKILSGGFTNGGFLLTGVGGTNAPYQIQAQTSLTTTNWLNLGTATADANGFIEFYDDGAGSRVQRFYRFSQ